MQFELDNVNYAIVSHYGYIYQFDESSFDMINGFCRQLVNEGKAIIMERGHKFIFEIKDEESKLFLKLLSARDSFHRNSLKDTVHIECCRQIAKLSKDAETKVGAKIVASDGSPVSEGYNGPARTIDDTKIPLVRSIFKEGKIRHCKYDYMIHAEQNAMNFADKSRMVGATLYVTHFPCKVCANNIAQNGISRVVVDGEGKARMTDENEIEVSKNIFRLAGIRVDYKK